MDSPPAQTAHQAEYYTIDDDKLDLAQHEHALLFDTSADSDDGNDGIVASSVDRKRKPDYAGSSTVGTVKKSAVMVCALALGAVLGAWLTARGDTAAVRWASTYLDSGRADARKQA